MNIFTRHIQANFHKLNGGSRAILERNFKFLPSQRGPCSNFKLNIREIRFEVQGIESQKIAHRHLRAAIWAGLALILLQIDDSTASNLKGQAIGQDVCQANLQLVDFSAIHFTYCCLLLCTMEWSCNYDNRIPSPYNTYSAWPLQLMWEKTGTLSFKKKKRKVTSLFFLTQGLNPGHLHCRQILYCLTHEGSPGNRHWRLMKFSSVYNIIFSTLYTPIETRYRAPKVQRTS